tara:strand:+ start:1178 stop:2869 length:1692 start_codon:yes stop_codon:yes gene_type:complete
VSAGIINVAGFKLTTFSGLNKKVSPRLLPEDVAQDTQNVFLDSGRIEGLKTDNNHSSEPSSHPASHIGSTTRTIFRATTSNWLTFTDDVDIIRSPIKEDSFNRIYFTGSGNFPKYGGQSNLISGSGPYPAASFRLGLPTPGAITSVSVDNSTAASGAATNSRAYIYTEITTFGEEGPPSAVNSSQIVDAANGATITLALPAASSGNLSISKRRIYRTDVNGVFRFVKDVSGTSAGNTTEAVLDDLLGEEVESADNLAPPDDVSGDHPDGPMLGITAMPNGITAGFSGNTLLFSEAFLPHSYPLANQLTTKEDIVAIASIASGLLVTTKGKPLMASGTDPSAIAMVEIDANLPCTNKRSLVDMGEYAIYASPDGLVLASNSGIQLITEQILTRDQWQSEYYPTNVEAYEYEGKYIAFTFDGSDNSTKKGFLFDPRGGKNAFVNLDFYATAGFNDREEDRLYLVIDGVLKDFASNATRRTYSWKSKVFYSNRPISPGVAKVSADSYSSLTFKLFADGSLKHTQTVTSENIFRLPGGYQAKSFEIQLEGTDTINEVCVYESPQEIT